MEALIEHITIKKSARYYRLGTFSSKTKSVWFVLHGYGQLAGDFINIFEKFVNDETVIIAPEGTHRFYLKGFSGKVGASWMTKEDWEKDIEDNNAYLTSLISKIKIQLSNQNVKFNALGFSQGTATLMRWFSQEQVDFNQIILWGGGLPHDVELTGIKEKSADTKITICIGNHDQFIKPEKVDEEIERVKSAGINCSFINYEGGHNIDLELLGKIFNQSLINSK
ncbi:MAG: hypothetical protein K9J16_07755 [Melioribacteraceae bacterium]|nr:hypothetical protein [Melioribacteraceae bacterium]MCF8353325.1 hypothetical protein [Melioribacteraceae bacterium]MCF8393189.1 hypothetical protein [Melioribacteraceae bacterium]MCF8419051.1 hypothetical protein [Melioribacteraceae bacterium]